MLEPGGLLYIWDVVFSFPPAEYAQHLQQMVDDLGHIDGNGFSREDFETHIREELSPDVAAHALCWAGAMGNLARGSGFEEIRTWTWAPPGRAADTAAKLPARRSAG